MLAFMQLRARQDILQYAFNLMDPTDDTISLEVYMHARDMPPTVLAVGLPQCIKELCSLHSDLSNYAKPHEVDAKLIPDWPKERIVVNAESPTLFYTIFCRAIMDLAFSNRVCADFRAFRHHACFSVDVPMTDLVFHGKCACLCCRSLYSMA